MPLLLNKTIRRPLQSVVFVTSYTYHTCMFYNYLDVHSLLGIYVQSHDQNKNIYTFKANTSTHDLVNSPSNEHTQNKQIWLTLTMLDKSVFEYALLAFENVFIHVHIYICNCIRINIIRGGREERGDRPQFVTISLFLGPKSRML